MVSSRLQFAYHRALLTTKKYPGEYRNILPGPGGVRGFMKQNRRTPRLEVYQPVSIWANQPEPRWRLLWLQQLARALLIRPFPP